MSNLAASLPHSTGCPLSTPTTVWPPLGKGPRRTSGRRPARNDRSTPSLPPLSCRRASATLAASWRQMADLAAAGHLYHPSASQRLGRATFYLFISFFSARLSQPLTPTPWSPSSPPLSVPPPPLLTPYARLRFPLTAANSPGLLTSSPAALSRRSLLLGQFSSNFVAVFLISYTAVKVEMLALKASNKEAEAVAALAARILHPVIIIVLCVSVGGREGGG